MKQLPLASKPEAELHTFKSSMGSHLFVTDGSRIYDVDPNIIDDIKKYSEGMFTTKDSDNDRLWRLSGFFSKRPEHRYIDGRSLSPPALYSISLNVAQMCNMSCGYCYADTGMFGGNARMMGLDVARASVDRLIAESNPHVDLVLGYMGGEPLLNRRVVHETTKYAAKVAKKANRKIRFSITTNATIVQKEDAELFANFPFTVTISIDGTKQQHDSVRRMRDGTSSYDRLISSLDLINHYGRPQHLSARVTVTPKTGELLPILDHGIRLGFDEIGFSAIVVSPVPSLAFVQADFPIFLRRMVACGRKALEEIKAGRHYPFGNFETALHEIHRGSHRPYPCGAGAAYLSANAEGNLFACHRLIDDPYYLMGNVQEGSDIKARAAHLSRSHVDRMEPCRSCWARYLCGGGCYHEVSRRGRIGCDYIRGWLSFCLKAYVEISSFRPEYFICANAPHQSISSPTTIQE